MVKVTFTLDDATIEKLRATAKRLNRPQSQVVREAVASYAPGNDRLSEDERRRRVELFDRLHKLAATRSKPDLDRELREIRRARTHGGRRHRVE